jgi:nucleoside-diphosphate-sugar epimerase
MTNGFGGLPLDDLHYAASRMKDHSALLSGSRILVVGASGFVGTWLTSALAELRESDPSLGFDILVLVRDARTAEERLGGDLWRKVVPVVVDVRSPWPAIAGVTHAIFGATPSSRRSGNLDARQVLLTSVFGMERLIEAVGDPNQPTRVLNLSSGAVYGPQPMTLSNIPEDWPEAFSPYAPSSPYAEGKRASESLLQQADRQGLVHAIQARLFAFMGPLLPTDEHFAIGNFVEDAARRRTIRVTGDGSSIRSYLEARDMASWLIGLLAMGGNDRAYNVGSPVGSPLSLWAQYCADFVGTSVTFGPATSDTPTNYVPDVSNSLDLGLVPAEPSPNDGIARWLKWLSS